LKNALLPNTTTRTHLLIFAGPMPPYQIRLSNFIHPVLKAYQMGHGRTMMYPIYGGVVMWDGPDSGLFDDFNVKVDPPHGMVRTPIVRQGW